MEKQERSSLTMKKIEDAAVELFGRKGLSGTSIDEITSSAGITKGAMYYHFQDKEDLFMSICERALDLYQKEVFDAGDKESTGSRVRAIITNSHRFDKRYPELSRLYARMMWEDGKEVRELQERFSSYLQCYKDRIKEAISQDMKDGLIRRVNIDTACAFLMVTIDGLMVREVGPIPYAQDGVSVDEMVDMVMDSFSK